MGVADPLLQKKPMCLSDGRYLAALHRLLKLPERLLADQLPGTAFFDPAYQHLLKAPFLPCRRRTICGPGADCSPELWLRFS
jgi:hypothetical protein